MRIQSGSITHKAANFIKTNYVLMAFIALLGAILAGLPYKEVSAQVALPPITVLDTENVTNGDGWMVTEFEMDPGCPSLNPAEGTLPYEAVWGDVHDWFGPALAPRADQTSGGDPSCYPDGWEGYETAPNRWVLTKTFTAPEDGLATVATTDFRGDGGARVRVNGVDAGVYGQWNQPAVSGETQIPVTAGTNTIEIEVRDTIGPNMVHGRLDILMTTIGAQYQVTKTSDPVEGSEVNPGDTVTYTVTVENTGTLDGDGYTLEDNLSDVLDDATFMGEPVVSPADAGTATLDGETLRFAADVPIGETVTLTYSVEVKGETQLGDGILRNVVVAPFSNCADGTGAGCVVEHRLPAEFLAPTGQNAMLMSVIAGALTLGGAVLYFKRRAIA